MFELDQLTMQFFQRLGEWQKQGNRNVTIKMETEYNCYRYAEVEIYDADAMEGMVITPEMEMPSTVGLIMQRMRRKKQHSEEVF
jgi:hypothetical protein